MIVLYISCQDSHESRADSQPEADHDQFFITQKFSFSPAANHVEMEDIYHKKNKSSSIS